MRFRPRSAPRSYTGIVHPFTLQMRWALHVSELGSTRYHGPEIPRSRDLIATSAYEKVPQVPKLTFHNRGSESVSQFPARSQAPVGRRQSPVRKSGDGLQLPSAAGLGPRSEVISMTEQSPPDARDPPCTKVSQRKSPRCP